MKKLLTLLIALVLTLSLTSCEMVPDSIMDKINEILNSFQGNGNNEHIHDFVILKEESKAADCITDGIEVSVCSCGEKTETVIPALGHDWKKASEITATCTSYGYIKYKCNGCGEIQFEETSPSGHEWNEFVENSRIVTCRKPECNSVKLGDPNGKYTEALTFSFTKDDEDNITAKYDEVLAMLEAADDYDTALHGYAESGVLADAYAVVDASHTELYDFVLYAISQRQLAEIAYYCDMDNTELEETYTYMMDYCTNLISTFYSLSQPFYDSCYREFYYYGMTEAEINAYLFDSNAVSNPEYTALSERNNAIEAEVVALLAATNGYPVAGDYLPVLYAEYVENNNKMAQLMGYENYLEYAYANVYGREYTYQDVAQFSGYVKEYLTPAYITIVDKFYNLKYTEKEVNEYYTQASESFFSSVRANTPLNDYIDTLAFTSNPNKMISFSDEFNKLMVDGNLFRGDYSGAFVTNITSCNIPIAYFGPSYDNAFTIAHEFGHYMNEIYSGGDIDQSYDLLEMHSQGNEMLYLHFVEPYLTKAGYRLLEVYQLLIMLDTVMAGFAVDTFEQAVYLNYYEGTNADVIMADGKITADEYDLLYQSILADFGATDYLSAEYWRYGMTVTSPCYYVSYSVSAISVLQLYGMAMNDGFDVAKDAYLKLFTYVDENPEMTMEEILDYAGMLSYNDEELYMYIKNFIKAI